MNNEYATSATTKQETTLTLQERYQGRQYSNCRLMDEWSSLQHPRRRLNIAAKRQRPWVGPRCQVQYHKALNLKLRAWPNQQTTERGSWQRAIGHGPNAQPLPSVCLKVDNASVRREVVRGSPSRRHPDTMQSVRSASTRRRGTVVTAMWSLRSPCRHGYGRRERHVNSSMTRYVVHSSPALEFLRPKSRRQGLFQCRRLSLVTQRGNM